MPRSTIFSESDLWNAFDVSHVYLKWHIATNESTYFMYLLFVLEEERGARIGDPPIPIHPYIL